MDNKLIEDVLVLRDGLQVHYRKYGVGKETIVILHGWGGNQLSFVGAIGNIDLEKFTVITFDQRGFGDTICDNKAVSLEILATDLKEVIEKLNLKDITLCGWSMGGLVAVEYFKRFNGKNVKKLSLVDVSMSVCNQDDRKLGFYDGTYTEKEAIADLYTIITNFYQFSEDLAFKGNMKIYDENMQRIFIDKVYNQNQGKLLPLLCMWIMAATSNIEETIKEIEVPVLFYHGERSTFCSERSCKAVTSLIKDVRVAEMTDCSHYIPIEKPKEFAEHLVNFALE